VVAVLLIAGDQEPLIPFVEVVGKGARELPEHMAATCVKTGVTSGFTVIGIVAMMPH
jgi:hypothetical protein